MADAGAAWQAMKDPYEKFIRQMNLRGNSTVFAADDKETQKLVEEQVARMWAEAIELDFDTSVKDLRLHESRADEPPDAYCTVNGKDTSLELTELVDGQFLARAKARNIKLDPADSNKRLAASSSEGFRQTQWDKGRFLEALNSRFQKKVELYQKRGLSFDVLVIYTGEFWLSPAEVDVWLSDSSFDSKGVFRECYLLFDYRPNFASDRYPMFKIKLV
jgi:predicted TIM-barrel fold metal-dependent hydrolase